MSYAVLHAHTEFSARDSIIRVEDLPKLAAERGWSACAITDHGAIEGVPYFMKECRKLGIKPIAGCELYISCPDAKIEGTDRFDKFNHLTVLCKNAKGWSSLMSVLSYAHKHHYDARRQKAAVPIDVILEKLTDCVVLSGCFSSPFWRGTDDAPSDLVRFKERFKDDFYLEVQALWDWDKQIDLNRAILDTSEALGIPIVVTPDCHFGSQDESHFHEALLALASHKVVGSPDAWRFSTKQIYLGTPDSIRAALANSGLSGEQAHRALETTKEINEKITDWTWNDLPAPRLPKIEGDMPALCREGLQRHGLLGKPDYDARLEKELSVFMKAGLDQYFLLVRHCLNLFRANGAEIGPRGSVGGSLVAFALGITSLDPIFHGLSFERFYAPGRCFPSGTRVLSHRGYIPIEEVNPGNDRVLTRSGWKMVIARHSRKYSGPMIANNFQTEAGRAYELISTPNHRIIRGDGEVEAGRIKVGQGGFFCLSGLRADIHMDPVPIHSKTEYLFPPMSDGCQTETRSASIALRRRPDCPMSDLRKDHHDDHMESSHLFPGLLGKKKGDKRAASYLPLVRERVPRPSESCRLLVEMRKAFSKERELPWADGLEGRLEDVRPLVVGGGFRPVLEMAQVGVQVRVGDICLGGRNDVHAGLLGSGVEEARGTQGLARAGSGEVEEGEETAGRSPLGALHGRGDLSYQGDDSGEGAEGTFLRIRGEDAVSGIQGGRAEVSSMRPFISCSDQSPESLLREEMLESFEMGVAAGGEVLSYSGTVYDLTVEGRHEYVAEGVLVHNSGWPDIDIDVDVKFRERVPEILRQEFGEDNVAQISNYACFGLRMAVKDAARVYGIKILDESKAWDDDKELKGTKDPDDVLKIDPGKELAQKSPEAIEFAKKLYGRIRQYGAHAGGFVITADPLSEGRSCIVSRGKDKALCWDMELAEEIGFIKFDFLGIDSLSAIKVVGDAAKIDWDKVPLDDAEVYKDISEGRTAGVPQFLTSGMRAFVEKLKPNKFEDLVWANAAFRPGALGQMTPGELAETYRRDPGAIIVYQEEVMQLCVDLAGFSWTEADAVRKTIAKSKGIEEMKKYEEKFIAGCIKTSAWVEEDARSFWKMLYNFGRYSFNRAHANSYSWSAYRIAWAKRHHPKETFSALANADPGDANLELLLDEAVDFDVSLLPPDPNKSGLEWNVEGDGIRSPITQMLGIDLRISKAIIKRRTMHGEFKDVADFNHKMKGIKYPPVLAERAFSGKSIADSFELPVKKNPKEKLLPPGFIDEIRGCTACDLRANCKAPVPPRFGKNNIMLVGEAPGWSEDKRGTPLIGKSGQLLMDLLEDQGITRDDLTITNSTSCFPNGDPNYDDKTCGWAQKTIDHLRPPLVLVVGKRAWHKIAGGKEAIGKVNGTIKEINGTKFMACIHPAAILRDLDLLPEIGRTVRKFAKLYRILVPIKKKNEVSADLPETVQNC